MIIQELIPGIVYCLIAANIVSSSAAIGRRPQPVITSKALLQNRAAVDNPSDPKHCLDETDSDIDWNENGNPPVVNIMFEYGNTCKRPVRCKVMVESGYRPSGAKKDDYSEWQLRDTLTFKFTLAGEETRKFLGTLWWFKTVMTIPSLRWPNPNRERNLEMIECSFADTKPPG